MRLIRVCYKNYIQFSGDITDLTNIHLFLVAKEVEDDLALKDVTKCLAWCHDNKSKLRKMKSTLEFDMRLQEFIELIKKNKKMDAIRHARKHLATEDQEQLSTVQRAMALLVFPTDTIISPYCEMLKDFRWNDLIQQFRTENYRLYQLSNQSVFTVALQVGLSALKTPMCYRSVKERNTECPVCEPCLNNLAKNLPNAHCSHSRLICHITGTPLNEHNPPLMLPNGYVYGEQALVKMADENDGQVICPRTKEIYPFRDCEKVYVM
uniref:Macrophage erythroblast attacher n=1 Tax=Lepeophtheirus salmonis TaxID=72036 RepID=A0A0K2UIZ2_LEPSM